MMKRAVAVLISAVMTLMCASTALAAVVNHNIDDGDLEIGEEGSANTYVVTSSGSLTSHKIVVRGASTTITLQNVNIAATGGSALDIGDDASVELVISGSNQLAIAGSDDKAAIHVSGGNLIISGSDADTDVLTARSLSSDGAAIGSSKNENFTGTITVNGGVTVNASVTGSGAAIGSGESGFMGGDIIINDGTVDAHSDSGTGIGAGVFGAMSGTVQISGGTVTAEGDDAGIGANGAMSGTIQISGGTVTAEGNDAGIGAGFFGDMSGDIIINGGTVEAHSDFGTGIGTKGDMSGTIQISDGTVTAEGSDAGIGGGFFGAMSGDIIIKGGTVEAHSGLGTGIGARGDMSGTIQISDGTVEAHSDLGTGIGAIRDMSGTITVSGGTVNITGAGEIGIGGGQAATGNIVIGKGADITLEEGAAIGTVSDFGGTLSVVPGAVINGVKISDAESLEKAGVLNGSMNVKVGSKSTYSLGKLNIVSRIKNAEAGDTVYVYESQLSKGKLPYYVLEELAEKDGVILAVVSESGDTAQFKAGDIPQKGRNAFLTVEELIQYSKL